MALVQQVIPVDTVNYPVIDFAIDPANDYFHISVLIGKHQERSASIRSAAMGDEPLGTCDKEPDYPHIRFDQFGHEQGCVNWRPLTTPTAEPGDV